MTRTVLIAAALLATVAAARPAAPPGPVKVFVLAGQSNMEGQAVVDLDGPNYNGGKGTLKAVLADPATAPLAKHLASPGGKWAVRDDVWVRYKREGKPLLAGPLTVGFTVYGDRHHFGPELQFGHVIGDHLAEPVLLVKTAWGGKSLYKDFRPPSSGGTVGPYYTKMVAEVREALAELGTDFPALAGRRAELAGFVWYQGWNDGVEPRNAVPEYERNLANLINDVRAEFKAPALPVVVGELTGPWVDAPGAWATLRKAQAAAAARPEFAGTVKYVPTRAFVRPAKDSPNPGHGHHEFGNAETCLLVGDALGKGMVELLTKRPAAPAPAAKATPERVGLWNGHAPKGDGTFEPADAFVTIHKPERPNGTAVVVCPGGGYGGLVTGAEGLGIAAWLYQHGVTGVVLEYRLPKGRPSVPLLDAQRAIRTVRANATAWGIDPAKVGIIGFSAGGHLASTAGTHFDAGDPTATDPVERQSSRPDFMMLVYPVISMGEKGHAGSRVNLLGKQPDDKLVRMFSNEAQVTDKTPPAFLAHAKDDKVVPPEHSRMFSDALRAKKVPVEYLELASGGHGLNGYKGPMWDAWQARSLAWLREQKFLPPGGDAK